ncbi:MAG: hypothetical protein HUU19_04410 [Phycisphaerales bacterium]|nr:hypothetical protein [Phycisphaerales bacterium]
MSDDQRDAIESTSSTAVSDSGSPVKPDPAAVLCPYCGSITPTGSRCSHCRGLLDPLSRQATTNTMGPWFIRDEAQPFRPGCSYHTLVSLIQRGKVTRTTIIRGPSTRQFWMFAGKVPGVAHLLGVCHSCQEESHADDFACNNCGAVFTAEEDRQRLGLGPVMEVPGQPLPDSRPPGKEVVARAASVAGSVAGPVPRPARSSAPMSAIMDDAVPWESPPRKSSGMLVGGVILSIAALAAAGFAVKTWVEANQGSAVQSVPLATPETGTTAPESEAVVPSQSQVQPEPTVAPGESPVKPGEQSMPAQEPPASVQPGTGPAAAAPVGWSEAWRTARGLP